jgi:hypothetical protein
VLSRSDDDEAIHPALAVSTQTGGGALIRSPIG